MREEEETCWTVIRGAAAGRPADREAFARGYAPLLLAWCRARWKGTPLLSEAEDAVQEVFLACFREGGALATAEEGRGGGFRAWLYGVARNVALMAERRHHQRRVAIPGGDSTVARSAAEEESLSAVFDRAFARRLLAEARRRQRRKAEAGGPDALRRVDLLRLRFEEDLPIREIARRWGEDPAKLHHEYARARREFHEALLAATAFYHPGPRAEVARECARLLDLFE